MAFNYSKMRKMATGLLSEFGGSFTLKKPNDSPKYDPKTKKTVTVYSEYPGKCVMKTYSDEAMGQLSNIIESGDVKFVCTLDDISIIPQADKDKLIYNKQVYNIIRVSTSNPSGKTVVVHTLQCRRASAI